MNEIIDKIEEPRHRPEEEVTEEQMSDFRDWIKDRVNKSRNLAEDPKGGEGTGDVHFYYLDDFKNVHEINPEQLNKDDYLIWKRLRRFYFIAQMEGFAKVPDEFRIFHEEFKTYESEVLMEGVQSRIQFADFVGNKLSAILGFESLHEEKLPEGFGF